MDNQDVCLRLNISPRTLQTLRDTGKLAYSQIQHKIYYKAEDVEKLVTYVGLKRKEKILEKKEKRLTYKIRQTMDDIITKSNERVAGFFRTLNEMQVKIEKIIDNSRPPLGGEKFLTDKELSGLLKISRRCLQDYRNQGRIPYIQLGGKILYKASDIEKLLEDNYHKALE